MTLEVVLKETCHACPEQYDAYVGAHRVGYVRLRAGYMRVTCPGVGGALVYDHVFEDEWMGRFESEAQRKEYLDKAKAAILKWRNEHKDEVLHGKEG